MRPKKTPPHKELLQHTTKLTGQQWCSILNSYVFSNLPIHLLGQRRYTSAEKVEQQQPLHLGKAGLGRLKGYLLFIEVGDRLRQIHIFYL